MLGKLNGFGQLAKDLDRIVPSLLFGGPVNTVKSGIPIPLAYGKLQVSGTPINFGFTSRRIKSHTGWVNINNPDQEGSGDVGGGGGGGGTAATELR